MKIFHWINRKRIDKYLSKTLSEKKQIAFEAHLRTCSDCRTLLQHEKQFMERLFAAGKTLGPSEAAWERAHARILALPSYPLAPQTTGFPEEKKRFIPLILNWRSGALAGAMVTVLVITLMSLNYYTRPSITPMKLSKTLGVGIYRQSLNSSTWEKIAMNAPLQDGDAIQTDEYSRTAIQIGNVSKIWINRSSQLKLHTGGVTAMDVTTGIVDIKVNHYPTVFQVNTPSGVVSVYGTEFQLTVDSTQHTIVSCIQDTVYFENAFGKSVVPAGYQSMAQPKQSPTPPVAVDVAALLDWKTQFEKLSGLSIEKRNELIKQYLVLGDNQYSSRDYKNALDNYQTAVSLAPGDYRGFYTVGRTYRAAGEYALATTQFLRAIERNSSDMVSRFQLAQSLIELKEYDSARVYLNELVKLNPNHHDNLFLLGDSYLMEGNYEQAQHYYDEASVKGAFSCITCAPGMYGGLAEIARHNNDISKAKEELNKAYQYKGLPSLVYVEAARLYRDVNDKELEKTSWSYYLQSNPKGAFSKEARNRIHELEFIPIAQNSTTSAP